MTSPWPFDEPTGKWDGRTFRWTSGPISIAQAKRLTGLRGFTWNVRELREGGRFEFAVSRRSEPETAYQPRQGQAA